MPTRPTTSSSPAWPASAWPLCFRVVLGDKRSSGASVRIRPGWNAPIGGVLLAVCGLIALAGFPLDDIWHRLFGQDVTLWGPTHIQMVGGAGLATLAVWALALEADHTAKRSRSPRVEWLSASVSAERC